MKRVTARRIAGLFCIVALLSTPLQAKDGDDKDQAYRNGAYYLLHTVCEDEDKLPLLLDIKSAPPEIKAFADRISQTAKATMAGLEKMQEADPRIKFDQNPLPAAEQDTRDLIKSDKQHQLLMGTSGDEFVRTLMVAQIEASTYALNLSKLLADHETSPQRAKTLRGISAKWLAIRQEATSHLREH